jgi:signal peptidase I
MEPNFHDGNYLLIDELTYRFREPTRGEVIVFKYPGDRRSYYIKRIIGLPGERITIQQGNVFIYRGGKQIALQETYAVSGHSVRNLELTLGPKDYFVMGDNRSFSFDSRSWGPVDRSLIIGIARLRLWPINQMTAFAAPVY